MFQNAAAGKREPSPSLLITNQLKASARKLIENNSQDGVDFFHVDALSSAVAMKINCDLLLTVMASSLYGLLGARVADGYEIAKSRHLFRDFVNTTAQVTITEQKSQYVCKSEPTTPICSQQVLIKPTSQFHGSATEDSASISGSCSMVLTQKTNVGIQGRPSSVSLTIRRRTREVGSLILAQITVQRSYGRKETSIVSRSPSCSLSPSTKTTDLGKISSEATIPLGYDSFMRQYEKQLSLRSRPTKKGKTSLVEFEVDINDHICQCPEGASPVYRSEREDGSFFVQFDSGKCRQCGQRDRCPVSNTGRLVYTKPNLALARRKKEQQPEFKEAYKIRSGIEATPALYPQVETTVA
jgi:hypothetical protein